MQWVAEQNDTAVSSDVLQQLELFAQYSAASYCESNINSTGDKLTCEAGNCAVVQEAETTTLYEFEAYVLSFLMFIHCLQACRDQVTRTDTDEKG